MKTKTVNLYTYDELNETAQETARNWYRNADSEFFGAECVTDDAATAADILGIDLRQTRKTRGDNTVHYVPTVYWSGFCSQGDGACFECTYRYKKGAAKLIRGHAPQDKKLHAIADALQAVQRKVFYRATASTQTGRGNSTSVSVECDGIDDAATWENLENAITGALTDFADWIYSNLEKEYEHENSDETVAETLIINEYTFTADGNRED